MSNHYILVVVEMEVAGVDLSDGIKKVVRTFLESEMIKQEVKELVERRDNYLRHKGRDEKTYEVASVCEIKHGDDVVTVRICAGYYGLQERRFFSDFRLKLPEKVVRLPVPEWVFASSDSWAIADSKWMLESEAKRELIKFFETILDSWKV